MLLQAVSKLNKLVMLKRYSSATIDEMLCSAEYILQNRDGQVILCEWGLRGFDKCARNQLDLAFVQIAKLPTHLSVIVDPCHAAGSRDTILAWTRATMAAGADGVLVEVRDRLHRALGDGPQALLPEEFAKLTASLV